MRWPLVRRSRLDRSQQALRLERSRYGAVHARCLMAEGYALVNDGTIEMVREHFTLYEGPPGHRVDAELHRSLVFFALEVIGCNAGAYTLRDAVIALRVATGDDGVNARWREPVGEEDLARLRRAVRSSKWNERPASVGATSTGGTR